ncbi:MAG: hypothetical protein ACKO7W_11395 [Elainella sp.]
MTARLSVRLLKAIFKLMQRYPAFGLLSGWAILVGIAIAATTTIMNPEASVDLKATSQPSPAPAIYRAPRVAGLPAPVPTGKTNRPAPATRSRPAASHSPTAAVSIILISCSAGCLFLSRCLKPRPALSSRRPDLVGQPRRLDQLATPTEPAAALPEFQAPAPLPEPAAPELASVDLFELVLPAQIEAPVYDGPLLAADETDSEPLDPIEAAVDLAAGESVDVAVVPEGQDHPLDWTEPSLADSLDLRQRRPLSYWLEGSG